MATVQEAIDAAKAEVARTKTVNESVRVAFKKYADIIEASKDDADELVEIASQMRTESDQMAALVEQGTTPTDPAPATE